MSAMMKAAGSVVGSATMKHALDSKTVLVVALTVLAGCQTYDFEQVEPLALAQTTQSKPIGRRELKPNVILLVDKSGSMNSPIVPPAASCGNCGPSNPCPASCPTRITELRNAMSTFLASAGASARFGLALFPTDNICGVTSSVSVPLPPEAAADDTASDSANVANAQLVNTQIQSSATNPAGGTPTNLSLRFVGGLDEINRNDFRQDLVILLTDGVPNCNSQNVNACCATPSQCDSPNPCQCTVSSCGGSNFCALGCLDRQGVVEAVQELRGRNIQTIVVGFGIGEQLGSDQQNAPDILNAMGAAGGFQRNCMVDADCGSADRCINASTCERKFFRATNGVELSAALAKISEGFGRNICQVKLEAQPDSASFLAVILDGVNLAAGADTWAYENAQVVFKGATCDRLQAATSNAQINVEVRIVTKL